MRRDPIDKVKIFRNKQRREQLDAIFSNMRELMWDSMNPSREVERIMNKLEDCNLPYDHYRMGQMIDLVRDNFKDQRSIQAMDQGKFEEIIIKKVFRELWRLTEASTFSQMEIKPSFQYQKQMAPFEQVSLKSLRLLSEMIKIDRFVCRILRFAVFLMQPAKLYSHNASILVETAKIFQFQLSQNCLQLQSEIMSIPPDEFIEFSQTFTNILNYQVLSERHHPPISLQAILAAMKICNKILDLDKQNKISKLQILSNAIRVAIEVSVDYGSGNHFHQKNQQSNSTSQQNYQKCNAKCMNKEQCHLQQSNQTQQSNTENAKKDKQYEVMSLLHCCVSICLKMEFIQEELADKMQFLLGILLPSIQTMWSGVQVMKMLLRVLYEQAFLQEDQMLQIGYYHPSLSHQINLLLDADS